jgi:hypothetical protein
MAKTTTTTKAKTKTTKKKPTVKAAAKTTKSSATKAKRTTAKAAVKSTKTVKSAKSNAAKKVVRKTSNSKFAFLRRGQVLLGGLFAALAVAAGFFMTNDSAQVFVGHLAKDELASRAGTVLAPAAHVLYEVEFRWLVVALLVVSAVIAILRGTRYKVIEDAGIKYRVQPLRWIDFAITGALAFEIAALLNGLQDAVALKASMVSIGLAALFAWVYERENAATGKPARVSYIASVIAVLVPVFALLATMVATNVYGVVRSPWYAYAAAAVVSISLLWTVRKQLTASASNYFFTDRSYNRVSVLTKVTLAVILIAGLYSK